MRHLREIAERDHLLTSHAHIGARHMHAIHIRPEHVHHLVALEADTHAIPKVRIDAPHLKRTPGNVDHRAASDANSVALAKG